jgi:amino acid adenylation domain-containing protein
MFLILSIRANIERLLPMHNQLTASVTPGAADAPFDPFAGPTITAVYPLTPSQREILISCLLDPVASLAYNESFAVTLQGELDVAALGAAVSALSARHDITRATVSPDGTSFCITDTPVALRVHDAATHPDIDPRTKLDEVIVQVQSVPYNLQAGPLLRCGLVRTADQSHTLVLGAHHMICDGWSLDVLLHDLSHLYEVHTGRRAVGLPPCQPYGAFIEAVSRLQETGAHAAARAYWLARFAEVPETLDLPGERNRPQRRTYHAFRVTSRMTASELAPLKLAAKAAKCSFFSWLLSGYTLLLNRLSGQNDIVVGIPAATQPLLGLTDVVGHCAAFMPIRCKVAQDDTVSALVQTLQGAVVDAQEHYAYSYGELIADLKLPRDPSRAPLVAAAFTHVGKYARHRLGFGSAEINYGLNPRHAETFDLHLNVIEDEHGLECLLHGNRALFDRSTAQVWLSDYVATLQQMAAGLQTPVRTLPCLSEADRQLQFSQWNNPIQHYAGPRWLHQLVEEQVRKTPHAPAVADTTTTLSYAQLWQRSATIAAALVAGGCQPGDVVGVCMERGVDLPAALLAILRAGAAYLPLDTDLPLARLGFMIDDVEMKQVVSTTATAGCLPADTISIICTDTLPAAERQTVLPQPDTDPVQTTAYVIYTSGSTGKPKGAMVGHDAIVNRMQWMQQQFCLTPHDRVLQKTAYSFDVSVWEFFWPLCFGAQLYLAPPGAHRDPAALAAIIQKQRITIIHFVPSMLNLFLDEAAAAHCQTLRCVILSGEAVSLDLKRKFYQHLATPLFNLYGPTEAAVDVSCWECHANDSSDPIPIGAPIANTSLYVLGPDLTPLPLGARGELCIGGVQVGLGYVNRPTLTKERFVEDPFVAGGRLYRTGDLARWRSDGVIQYLGRLDFQVKLRGMRIEPGEAEAVLKADPSVNDALVTVWQDPAGQAHLVAYVASRAPADPLENRLRGCADRLLPAVLRPSRYVILPQFPHLTSGKIDRKALPAPVLQLPAPVGISEGPDKTMLPLIMAIWAKYLLRPTFDPAANFFDLGGDSFSAIQAMRDLSASLQRSLPVVTLFQFPTAAALAAALQDHGEEAAADPESETHRIEQRKASLRHKHRP